MKLLLSVLATAIAAILGTYFFLEKRAESDRREAQELYATLVTKERELLGFTKYTTFLTASKQALAGQMSLLAAKVTRDEGITQIVERDLAVLTSSGTVAIWYTAEYSFGFNLAPEQYDVRAVPSGIEITLKKPTLVATPAVSNLRHQVLSGGMFTDDKGAALKLQQGAAASALKTGKVMAGDPAIVALCEKKLVEFLRSFLAKQPGVTSVPSISVVYR